MRIRIINTSGRPQTTRVLDAASDEPLEGVLAVTIHPILPGSGWLVADITVQVAALDVIAETQQDAAALGVRTRHSAQAAAMALDALARDGC